MSFELTTAPGTFIEPMIEVLNGKFVVVYLDDLKFLDIWGG